MAINVISFVKSLFTKPKPEPPKISLSPSIYSSKVTTPSSTGHTPTYSGTPATGGSYPKVVSGRGGGGGGGGAAPATQPAVSVQVDKPTTTQKPLADGTGFTGKVVQSYMGQKEKEMYYKEGKEVGRITTPVKRYTRGGFDIVEKDEPYAETTTPSTFTFKRPSGVTEEVTFRETGAEVLSKVGVDLPALDTSPPTREPGVKGFVPGVVSRVKTAGTYQEFFGGMKEEVALSFPKVLAKVGPGLGGAWEQVKWLGPEQIKYLVRKGREKGILPTKEFYETPKGRQAKETTEILLMGAMVTPLGLGRQAIITTAPLRQRAKPYAVEEIRTAVVKGKPIRYSDYMIVAEKHPPRIQITETLTRSQMGKAPLEVKYLPKVTSYTGTPFKATAQDPFIVLETTTGKVGTISRVTGVSQRLDILKYKQLPPTQKFLVQRLAQAKAGGRPVSDTNIFKMFGKEDLRYTSQIEVQKLAKTKPDPYFLRLKRELPERGLTKPGKTITRYEAVTEIKTLKETEILEYTKSRVLFKDVTFPGVRATGTTPELKVFTTEYKIPTIISKGEPVGIIKPADIVKTPLGKTFQLQQQKELFLKVPPPKTPKAITTTKTIPATQQPETISRITSAYVGTGLYERTAGGQLPRTQLSQTMMVRETQFIKAQPRLTETQISRGKYVSKPRERLIAKEVSIELPKEITKSITKLTQKPIQKQTQRVIQKQAQKQITRTPAFFWLPPPRVPQVPKERFGVVKPILRRKETERGGIYRVFGRRFGEFKQIGYGRTPLEAVGMGERWAKQTLGVTFKIPSYRGKKVPGFRTKYTKKGTLFIEPRGKRLKRGTKEIPEILYWKKTKAKPKPFSPTKKKKKKMWWEL